MCGRFNYGSDVRHMSGWQDLFQEWPDVKASYNVAPGSEIAAFKDIKGESMKWGLVPKWADEFETKYSTFNARIETVDEKPTFRSAWHNANRCIIPMVGYYEWRGEKGNRQPFYITDPDTGGLALAGLYESWKLGKFYSCTVLTKPADEEMKHIHSRIPIILTPDTADDWLNCRDNLDKDKIADIPRPGLIYYPVSKGVNSATNDRKSLIEPLES